MGNRFPSEIAHISSVEFQRLEARLYEEAEAAQAKAREMERDNWLKHGGERRKV